MKRLAYLTELGLLVLLLPAAWLVHAFRRDNRKVVILGWYGSETCGDVAILGQIIKEWREAFNGAQLLVSSFDAAVTRRSLRDLGELEKVKLVRAGARSAWHLGTARWVVLGGGPLMESPSMPVWALRAVLDRLAGSVVP